MTVHYFPKGGMCGACLHREVDCSHLDFSTMPVITTDGTDHYVRCLGYARRPFAEIMNDVNARQAMLEAAGDAALLSQQDKLAEAMAQLEIEAKAIEDALEDVWIRVKVDAIPEDKLEAYDKGQRDLDKALRNYAAALRKGMKE